MTEHQPLLGRLSRWFHEYHVSDAFRLLLDDETARTAFLDLISETARVDVSAVTAFERERRVSEGQLDLQGVDPQGRPRLIVEAKFGHTMSDEQMRRYVTHQAAALAGAGHTAPVEGVLLLLVPQPRLADATAIMAHLADSLAERGRDLEDRLAQVVPVALSWEHCLDTIMEAVLPLDAGPISTAADTAQLRALCGTLAEQVAPLADIPESEQAARLRHVVLDLLKERLPGRTFKMSPGGGFTTFRYYESAPGHDNGLVYAIGLAPGLRSDSDPTDVWLRFHKDTRDFTGIQERIHRSVLYPRSRSHLGHLWFPLDVDSDLPTPELVSRLAEQVAVIVAAGSAPRGLGNQVADDPTHDPTEEPLEEGPYAP